MNHLADIAGRVDVITPKTGDTIVVSVDRHLAREQHHYIHDLLTKSMPAGVNILVLDKGVSLQHIEAHKSE